MKRKILSMLLVTAMTGSLLAGCGSSSTQSTSSGNTDTTAKEESAAAETEKAASDDAASDNATSEAAASDDETFNIDLATAYASDAPAGIAMADFVDAVAEKSNGTINITLYADGTLGSSSDNYASVASGDIDMTMAGLEGLDLYAPEYTFLDCPFLMKSLEHQQALLDSGIGDDLKAVYEENGFVTLGWHHRDVRVLASNKEITSPDDVKNLKLRLPGMTVYVDAWSDLGVSSTTVAMGELYTALSTNVAEACEGGYEQMTTLKLYEVQDYIAETDHVYEFVGLYINKDLWDSMSENQHNVLQECADEYLAEADQLAEESRENYKQECLDGGMTLVDIDTDAFREALTDFYKEQFESKWTVTTYDEVMGYAE